MRIKIPSWLLTAILLATVSSVAAQQPKKVPRIGYLSSLSPSSESSVREVKEDLPAAARALGLTVQPSELRDADSVARVFAAMVKQVGQIAQIMGRKLATVQGEYVKQGWA